MEAMAAALVIATGAVLVVLGFTVTPDPESYVVLFMGSLMVGFGLSRMGTR